MVNIKAMIAVGYHRTNVACKYCQDSLCYYPPAGEYDNGFLFCCNTIECVAATVFDKTIVDLRYAAS